MTLERRTQALLDLVEDDRRQQCDALLAKAQAEAAALLAMARGEARGRVREAFAEERQRAQAAVAAAQAQLQTRRRLHEQRHAAAWLALGWQQLPRALRQRWQDAAARGRWVDTALHSARQALRPGPWQIAHAEGLGEGERQALAARLQRENGAAPRWTLDAALEAGLRIAADGNVVDATLAGLLADRNEIGSRLLGALEAAA